MMIRWIFSLILFSQTAWSAAQSYVLDNGLQLIVKPDHRSPVVVSQIWYKIGSSYEPPGLTGISHVLEHMMFKGTDKIAPDEFSRIIASLGGSENAFTGRDYTAYFETLSKQHLEKAFELEADRMRNLRLDEAEFQKEVAVVREERRLRTEDNPNGLLWEQFNALAWRVSPYRNPIIGWMHDLEQMQWQDLQQWYQRWYSPNNAILVVVGDVQPDQVYQLAQKYFGHIENLEAPPFKAVVEPQQRGITRFQLQVKAKQSILLMGYKVPHAKQDLEQAYALQILAKILGGGDSSRLSTHLVRQANIAVSAEASYDPFTRLPSLLVLELIPAQGIKLAVLEQAVKAEIQSLQQTGIKEEELKKVIQQMVAEKIYAQDSLFHQAMLIGMRASRGYDWRSLEQDIEKLQQISPEQVQKAAQLLQDQVLTVAILEANNE